MFTDIHIHLLPQVDDGSQSYDETLAMARCAEADGVKRIVCTPHMNADIDPLSRLDGFEALRASVQAMLDAEGIGVTLECGAEWMLSADLIDVVRERGRLAGTKAFLFELSPFMTAVAAEGLVEDAAELGLRPVLAHPERYPWLSAQNAAQLKPLADMGCVFQLTSASLAGNFGRDVRRAGEAVARMYPDSIVLATDAHNMDRRKPVLSDGYRALEALERGLAARAQAQLTNLPNPD
ncbi:MAG: hypothetical protein MJ061_00980 [Mailhella sp.]|nr:hypothetical protein [Mailhella sp.]